MIGGGYSDPDSSYGSLHTEKFGNVIEFDNVTGTGMIDAWIISAVSSSPTSR